jgi:hypothetical protein
VAAPSWGAPSWGAPSWGAPSWGAPSWRAPSWREGTLRRRQRRRPPQRDRAGRASDTGHQCGRRRPPDVSVHAERRQRHRERARVGVLQVERLKHQPGRGGTGRVRGAAPADEERDQASGQRAAGEPPLQHRPGGCRPPHAGHLARVVPGPPRRRGRLLDVLARQRPSGQAAAGDAVDAERAGPGRVRLTGVGSDDLQVDAGAEPQQRVAGAEADVPASAHGADASAPRDLRHRRVQVASGVHEVIDQHRSLCSVIRWRPPPL